MKKFISNLIGKLREKSKIRKGFSIEPDEVVIYGIYINRRGIAYNIITGKLSPKLDFNLRFCIKTTVFSDFGPSRPTRHKAIISKTPVGRFYSKVKFHGYFLEKIHEKNNSGYYQAEVLLDTKNYEGGLRIENGHIIFMTRDEDIMKNLNLCLDFSQEYYLSFVEL